MRAAASSPGLVVAGGTYREWCGEPPPDWDQLFGSGLRGAAAVQSLATADGAAVTLVTCVGPDDADDLAVYAATFGICVDVVPIERTLAFAYEHPLAAADMTPTADGLGPARALAADGPAVLRYGMVEASVRVRGDRVVYDPQAGAHAERFDANGSTARELAIVANLREAGLLVGAHAMSQATAQDGDNWSPGPSPEDVTALGRALITGHGAAVAVIKRGARGLSVFTRGATADDVTECTLPAYETHRVWPIGSGDVFSAVFAYHWAVRRQAPEVAATAASRATAYYCETRCLPVPLDVESALGRALRPLRPAGEGERRRVYLAGPFFTASHRWLIRHLRRALVDHGVDVFSPWHDVGFGAATEVAPRDMEGLRQAYAVLAVLDGSDAGTLFEVGAARELGLPVVGLAEAEPSGHLTMPEGTGCLIVRDLATAVYRTVWAALEAPAAGAGGDAPRPVSPGEGQ